MIVIYLIFILIRIFKCELIQTEKIRSNHCWNKSNVVWY